MRSRPVVYLLHFHKPYPGGKRPQHYMGVAANLRDRIREHASGSSKGRLSRAFHEKGIGFFLDRVWRTSNPQAAFDKERALKASKNLRRYCRTCKYAEVL